MKHVFVVGAPRSGTTWVQLLVAQHPEVATCQETHLFARYMSGLWNGWRRETDPDVARDLGISQLVTREEWIGLCRDLADEVLDRVVADRPDATTIVEKTPGHVLHAPLIRELYPDARFLHVVRDPRAVVASMRRAGQGWGSWWAPTGVLACAETWRRHVEAGLQAAERDPGWMLVRYESLLDDCPISLSEIFAFLNLNAPSGLCAEACRACHIDRLKERDAPPRMPWKLQDEPDGFFGPGAADSWRQELSAGAVRRVEFVAGDLMRRLGYESTDKNRMRPIAIHFRDGLRWLRASLDRALGGVVRRL